VTEAVYRTGRPSTAERLRAAAREVFADVGFVAARVEDVVDRAAVSHGTFYTYYANKQAVLVDLVETAAARLQRIADEPWEDPNPKAALERVIGQFLAVYAEESDVIRAWVQAAATDPALSAQLRGLRQGFVARVAEQLAPLAEAGGHDPATAASALVAMVEGYTVDHLTDPATPPPEVVRTLAALWAGGLAALTDT